MAGDGWLRAGTTIQLDDRVDDRPSEPGEAAPTAWLQLPRAVTAAAVAPPGRPSGARLVAPIKQVVPATDRAAEGAVRVEVTP